MQNRIPPPIIIFILTAICAPSVPAETLSVWANGVSESGGWVDANKSSTDPRDDPLCWAAASSNIIDWWQDKADPAKIPAGTPIGNDKIFEKFVETFSTGKTPEVGFAWYFGGGNTQGSSGFTGGKYWEDYIKACGLENPDGLPSYIKSYFARDDKGIFGARDFVSNICSIFVNGGGVTLNLNSSLGTSNDYGANGHSVTLWGVDYDSDSMQATKIYITDSDDYQTKLRGISLEYESTEHPAEEGKDGKEEPAWTETKILMTNYFGISNCTITQWIALDLPYAVPEPSAFALLAGLSAAVICASRRRRSRKLG